MKNDMTRDEHLDRIVAKCRELLAIAEKRTRGPRELDCYTHGGGRLYVGFPRVLVAEYYRREDREYYFKASAGHAEASWRATVAAIESCREIRSPDTGQVLDAIVAAWTEERP
jgi:hypothetical protein